MDNREYSKQWMEQFAGELGFSTDRVLAQAEEWLNYGEYWSEGGTFEGIGVPDEFWEHFRVLTGKEGNGQFFTCSC